MKHPEKPALEKISAETVQADFNDPIAVVHYARAAHFLGLWKSERIMIERFFPDTEIAVLEAGCGAGRVTIGLWEMGFKNLTAFDFAAELIDQARTLAKDRDASGIRFLQADATCLSASLKPATPFDAVFFMFNGLMQIPGRDSRRTALQQIGAMCRSGAKFLFTTHDRQANPRDAATWREEKRRWERGTQDPRLREFGDRYFSDESGRTFMHLPDRVEVLSDLAASGWRHEFDSMRSGISREGRAVRDFSDECRFWVATKD